MRSGVNVDEAGRYAHPFEPGQDCGLDDPEAVF